MKEWKLTEDDAEIQEDSQGNIMVILKRDVVQ